jgi:hypothetical protein
MIAAFNRAAVAGNWWRGNKNGFIRGKEVVPMSAGAFT